LLLEIKQLSSARCLCRVMLFENLQLVLIGLGDRRGTLLLALETLIPATLQGLMGVCVAINVLLSVPCNGLVALSDYFTHRGRDVSRNGRHYIDRTPIGRVAGTIDACNLAKGIQSLLWIRKRGLYVGC
jgi:hypothetical protein